MHNWIPAFTSAFSSSSLSLQLPPVSLSLSSLSPFLLLFFFLSLLGFQGAPLLLCSIFTSFRLFINFFFPKYYLIWFWITFYQLNLMFDLLVSKMFYFFQVSCFNECLMFELRSMRFCFNLILFWPYCYCLIFFLVWFVRNIVSLVVSARTVVGYLRILLLLIYWVLKLFFFCGKVLTVLM